ncbi:UvrD-helicase domain-containing protein [Deinococcus aetherius]|uniref:UvrD-helicase domain-containing protein n=1 Tax=Deinococcus aetherius TaxID=200252 RepID=UPI003873795A
MVAVRETERHLVLRATAGSGKTTTLTEAAWHLDITRPVVYFAYNKHSVTDVGPRLPPRVWASTLHAYGLRVLSRERNASLDVDEDKSLRLAGLLYAGERVERRVLRAAARAWDAAREQALDGGAHEDDLVALALAAEWPAEQGLSALRRVLHGMKRLSLHDWQAGGRPDFTDFLWLPLELGCAEGTLGVALVDEAQDLTPLRQRFVTHLLGLSGDSRRAGRLIAVGDPEQAIYTYAGADPQGLWRLAERLSAQELPLSVSFRCPVSHVQLARNASTFIQAAPQARLGTVEHLAADTATYTRGDVILSRLNAPLVRAALLLMTRNVSVNIRGRDLAIRLETAAQDAFPLPFTKDEIKDLVNVVYEKRATPLVKKAKEGDLAAKKALGELKDLCACLRLLALRAVNVAGGMANVTDVMDVLRGLYHEDADVLLSTVHRAKGLEWERVTLLYPELMPSPHGDPEEERCVLFVALTRSKDTLRLAYGKESWANGWRLEPATLPENETTPLQEAEIVMPEEAEGQPAQVEDAPPPRRLPVRPVPPPAVSERVHHAQRLREVQVPQDVEDPRGLPLYGGPDPMLVLALRERLEVLLEEPRPALREWAEGSLTLLRTVGSRQVRVHAATLKQVERAASQARLAVPLMQALTATQVPVVVFEAHFARVRAGQVMRRGERVWSVTVDGQALRFEPRTGEVLGELFTPLAPHLQRK